MTIQGASRRKSLRILHRLEAALHTVGIMTMDGLVDTGSVEAYQQISPLPLRFILWNYHGVNLERVFKSAIVWQKGGFREPECSIHEV